MKLSYLFIIPVIAATSCSNQKNSSEDNKNTASENTVLLTDTEIKTAGIELAKPVKGFTSSFLKVNGLIDVPPQNVVSISFPFGGYLVSTKLMPGMKVFKGQAIAEMQDQSLIQMQQDYLVAKAKVNFLQKEYDRQKLLNSTKTSSDKVLEQTESEFQTQKILMNSLREKLRMVHIDASSLNENKIRRSVMIYSPINGYVSAVHINIGKYVNPSDVLFELINPADLHFAVKVFEKDLPYIQAGQQLKVNLVNNLQKTFDAEISLISKNLDGDRSALVHCHFLNATDELLPGMFANATIETKNREGILVPEDAVVNWGDQHYVFIQKERYQFEMTPVKAGNSVNGSTDIQSPSLNLLEQTLISKNAYTALMKIKNKAE
jgi:cobalt-zinc-cadmium efflux system membrane fusion protein